MLLFASNKYTVQEFRVKMALIELSVGSFACQKGKENTREGYKMYVIKGTSQNVPEPFVLFMEFKLLKLFFFELPSAYLLFLKFHLGVNELAEISLLRAFSDHLVILIVRVFISGGI